MSYYYIYIDRVIVFDQPVPSEGYTFGSGESDLGTDCFIPLNEEQISFYLQTPEASVQEIYFLNYDVIRLKKELLQKIIRYDASSAVNSFRINNIEMWLSRDERVALSHTAKVLIESGIEETELWTSGDNPVSITITSSNLMSLLSSLEVYAKHCYDVTARHKSAVNQLSDVQSIQFYDYTLSYPPQINITL